MLLCSNGQRKQIPEAAIDKKTIRNENIKLQQFLPPTVPLWYHRSILLFSNRRTGIREQEGLMVVENAIPQGPTQATSRLGPATMGHGASDVNFLTPDLIRSKRLGPNPM